MAEKQAVVIGAGMAGLAAAALLAKPGRDVSVRKIDDEQR